MTHAVKIFGDPMPKGSMHCIGPRKCRGCGGTVVHNVQPDDSSGRGKEWRAKLEVAGRALHKAAGGTITAPVSVDATFVLARPAAARKRLWPHVRPDVDKLARMLLDALTKAAVIADDSLVIELVCRKRYPGPDSLDRPGVLVLVEPLDASDTVLPGV